MISQCMNSSPTNPVQIMNKLKAQHKTKRMYFIINKLTWRGPIKRFSQTIQKAFHKNKK